MQEDHDAQQANLQNYHADELEDFKTHNEQLKEKVDNFKTEIKDL